MTTHGGVPVEVAAERLKKKCGFCRRKRQRCSGGEDIRVR